MFQKIIVGIDGREQRSEALALARQLARGENERLIVATVYAHRALPHGVVDTTPRDEANEVLDREAGGLPGAKFVAVSAGTVAHGLHELAELEQADVLILGASHHGAKGRVLLGSTATAVLHHAPCAVCVAPAGFEPRDGSPQVIGVGYDGGQESERALVVAERIARDAGASLQVWSVVASRGVASDGASAVTSSEGEEAGRNLEPALARLQMSVSGEVLEGDAAQELVSRSAGMDLLVLGSRDHGLVGRLVLGSTSQRLLREAHCPVLVMPRGADRPAPSRPTAAADAVV
jgi:nucleotide-binding universal stress UspA family protein